MQILRIRKDAAACVLLHAFSPFIHDLNAFFAPVGGLGLTNRKICFRQLAAYSCYDADIFGQLGARYMRLRLSRDLENRLNRTTEQFRVDWPAFQTEIAGESSASETEDIDQKIWK